MREYFMHIRFLEPVSRYVACVIGGIIYGIGLNVFVGPIHLYMGGLTGIAQILNTILSGILPAGVNVTGLFVLLINIPLLFLAFKAMNRVFFQKTVLTIIAETIALSLIPIPSAPLADNPLTLSLFGGIISGIGAGIILRYGGSSGGVDIIGIYMALKRPNVSVGKLSAIIALFVFLYCFVFYPFETVLYSVIYTMLCTLIMDKVYLQNIKVAVLVITKKPDHWAYINNELQRGATVWRGIGAYSGEDTYIIYSVVSKYEMPILRGHLRRNDPNSFMVSWDHVQVGGNFESHLFS